MMVRMVTARTSRAVGRAPTLPAGLAPGTIAGLVLAAGPGSRLGGPKALVNDATGVPWVRGRAQTLLDVGCAPVLATVGAEAIRVRSSLQPGVSAVHVREWKTGMGASVRAALASLTTMREELEAVLVCVVDTPGLTVEVAAAVIETAVAAARGRSLHGALVQAVYGGTPGHPVLIGRNHWLGVHLDAEGDVGARRYLEHEKVRRVEVGDLGDGRDIDTPEDLAASREA